MATTCSGCESPRRTSTSRNTSVSAQSAGNSRTLTTPDGSPNSPIPKPQNGSTEPLAFFPIVGRGGAGQRRYGMRSLAVAAGFVTGAIVFFNYSVDEPTAVALATEAAEAAAREAREAAQTQVPWPPDAPPIAPISPASSAEAHVAQDMQQHSAGFPFHTGPALAAAAAGPAANWKTPAAGIQASTVPQQPAGLQNMPIKEVMKLNLGIQAIPFLVVGIQKPGNGTLETFIKTRLSTLGTYAMVAKVEPRSVQRRMLDSMTLIDEWLIDAQKNSKLNNRFTDSVVDNDRVASVLSFRRALQYAKDVRASVALILEGDVEIEPTELQVVNANLSAVINYIVQHVSSVEPKWSVVSLGRCLDHCSQETVVSDGLVRSPFALCSTAYLVSMRGVGELLSHTLPILTTMGHLVPMLARQVAGFRMFSVKPRLFIPAKPQPPAPGEDPVNIEHGGPAPTCAAKEIDHWDNFDRRLMYRIRRVPMRMSVTGRKLKKKYLDMQKIPITGILPRGFHCAIHKRKDRKKPIDENVRQVLEHMRRLDLKGFLVWDFYNKNHTHRFMHEAFYQTFRYIAEQSDEPLHACWINPGNMTGVSLTKAFQYSPTNRHGQRRGLLGSSLVMCSPKHMPWSEDPGFELLSDDPSSKYVFHDFVPTPLLKLRDRGDAVQWVVWGPDGNYPWFDAVDYLLQMRMPWTEQFEGPPLPGLPRIAGCGKGPDRYICVSTVQRLFVAPWATPLLGDEIVESNILDRVGFLHGVAELGAFDGAGLRAEKRRLRGYIPEGGAVLKFVGSIWDGNKDYVTRFVQGCTGASIHLYGMLPPLRSAWVVLNDTGRFAYSQEFVTTEEYVRWLRSPSATFMPAMQGYSHLKPGINSYIADRGITMGAAGHIIGTNNPAVLELFSDFRDAVVYEPDVARLCDAYVSALRDYDRRLGTVSALLRHIRAQHTYVSRFRDLLSMF